MKRFVVFGVLAVLLASAAFAQDTTPTPAFGSLLDDAPPAEQDAQTSIGAPPEPTATEQPAATPPLEVTEEGSDARLATCAAPMLPDFVPYIVRAGDRLGDLLTGVDNLTVNQLALLNCLDDPAALPVGATIWVPRPSTAGAGVQPEATGEVSGEEPIEDAGMARIDRLEASGDPVLNQEGVTFTWEAAGAEAYFYSCAADPDVDCRRPIQAQPLPLDYAVTIQDFPYAGTRRFQLEIVGGGERVTENITVDVQCSHESLGLVSGYQSCPEAPPLAAYGAWQPFEHGVMIYFGDTGEIYVMTNADNRVQVFPDLFEEGMDEPDYDDVPENRVPARRGFGIVWEQLGGPESPLGWGLSEEIGFDTARQSAGRVSFTTYIKGPGDVVYAVTLVPDTGAGYWTQIKG